MTSDREHFYKKFNINQCCVIIPTYNNGTTLATVITEVLNYTDKIIVINDGSTDATSSILAEYSQLHIIHQPKNMGKGVALRTGFKAASELNYKYAITIDSDGQHYASDIPKFIEKLEQEPGSLIIGARNMNQDSVPGKSSFGHKFSNFWFWFETGIRIPDTQSGFRLYPLDPLKEIKWFTTKYEFEIEVIVRAAWTGVKIDSVPVQVFYAPKETRISHFRPFQDFSRVSVLNVFLVTITIIYIKPLKIFRSISKKKILKLIEKNIFNPEESNSRKTLSVMFGVFMGIFPIWGFQLLVGIPLAHFLKLNKVIFVMAAHISIPVMLPIIIYLSYMTGGKLLNNSQENIIFHHDFSLAAIQHNLYQYYIGAVAFSLIAGICAGLLTIVLLKLFPLKSKALEAYHTN